MATTRVVFDPLFAIDREQQRKLADGARVRLTQFGEVNSTPSGVPIPATLRLIGVHIDRARERQQTNEIPIAELKGTLRLQPENGLPTFEGDADDAGLPKGWVGLEPAVTNPALEPRLLRFDFAEEQFRQVPTDGDASVVVTVDPKQFPYLEVQVELELNGAVEVPREKNDHLDVLITKFNPPKAFGVEPRTGPKPTATPTGAPTPAPAPGTPIPSPSPPGTPPRVPPPDRVEAPDPDLPERGDSDKLVPLKPGAKFRDSKVKFEIEINGKGGFTSDKTTVSIVDGGGATVYAEVFEKEGYMRTVGTHTWLWDGFGSNEVLDTKVLKDQKLRLVVTVEKGAHKATGTLKLKNEAEDAPWTDARIDLKAKAVALTFYVNCQNEGDLSSADFNRLVGLLKSGISRTPNPQTSIRV